MSKSICTTLIFFLALVFYPLSSSAQKDYHTGYVVLKNNDTLFGKVKDRKSGAFGGLYEKIRFKGDKGKSKYRPNELTAYSRGDEVYESVWILTSSRFFNTNYTSSPGEGELQFLRVLAKGRVTYYHMEFEDSDSGYIDAIPLFKKKGHPAMERVTQGIFGLRKKRLAAYFQDCPTLAAKILNEEVKDPYAVVQLYNDCDLVN